MAAAGGGAAPGTSGSTKVPSLADGGSTPLGTAVRAASLSGLLPPPPHAALAGCEPGSFANGTITARLPAILSGLLRDMAADREAAAAGDAAALAQVHAALADVSALRQAMLDDAVLPLLELPGSASALTQELLGAANACLEHGCAVLPPGTRPSWLGLPWLLVECYMYAAIHAALQRQPALAGYDPFAIQKEAAWAKSRAAAAAMASQLEPLLAAAPTTTSTSTGGAAAAAAAAAAGVVADHTAAAAAAHDGEEAVLAVRRVLLAALQTALWGNKTDLSLLVDASALDETHTAMAAAPPAGHHHHAHAPASPQATHIIVDDSEAALDTMIALRARRRTSQALDTSSSSNSSSARAARAPSPTVRIDLVLDNSGLELFADLLLADALLQTGVADHVALHGKAIPWFVSDTLEGDLASLLDSCSSSSQAGGAAAAAGNGNSTAPGGEDGSWSVVLRMAQRWRGHLSSGRWSWSTHPFWTTPAPFCWMGRLAPELYDSLHGSSLVIFKGDLNYRKLTHDCRWPHTAPFSTSLQGFTPAPLLALRTLKADVVAGLADGLSEQLYSWDRDWLVNGKWGMIQYVAPQDGQI